MPLLPESPRARRRLFVSGAAAALVLAGLLVALLIPSRQASNGAPTSNEGPAQLAVDTHLKVKPADRRKIDHLLDQFIPAAVERKDMALAYRLAGPEMKAAQSRNAFLGGTAPVPRFPANEKNYHHWRAVDVEKNAVILNILVHPTDIYRVATWEFSIQVVKSKSHWLVNRIYTIAVMNPVKRADTVTHELGPADYAAPPSGGTSRGKVSHPFFVGKKGLLPGLIVIGIVLSLPLLLGIVAFVRARRWKKTARANPRNTIPALPSSYRKQRDDEHDLASHS